jgi:formate dehydrogenase iron-sulfur subunit
MEVPPVNGKSPITTLVFTGLAAALLMLATPGSLSIADGSSHGFATAGLAVTMPSAYAQEAADGSGMPQDDERPSGEEEDSAGSADEAVNAVTSANSVRIPAPDEAVVDPGVPLENTPHLSPEALELLHQSTGRGGPYGVLVDLTVCVGCRACVVACKEKNDLPLDQADYVQLAARDQLNKLDPSVVTEQPKLSADAFTVVEYHLVGEQGKEPFWVFVKRQCMHCLQPACESACPVGAFEKNEQGPVLYDAGKCMGCRYCMMACPFGVPTYEWDSWNPVVKKCTFCFDLILDESLPPTERVPACVRSCPANALVFGNRDVLLREAHRRIENNPGKYVDHVYGEFEAGGTSWLYISPVPFEELGFPTNVGVRPYPEYTAGALGSVPLVVVFGSTLLAGLYVALKRRREGNGDKGDRGGGGSSLSSRMKLFIAIVVLGAAAIVGMYTIFTHHTQAGAHTSEPLRTAMENVVR